MQPTTNQTLEPQEILQTVLTPEEKARKELFKNVSGAFRQYNNRVFLNAGTGTGKTKVAIELLDDCIGNITALDQDSKWDIVVPNKILIQSWEDEFIRWGKSHLLPFVNIYCYQSLHKQDPTRLRNIIIDEGQWMTEKSHLRVKYLLGNKNLIVLTATMPKRKKHFYEDLGITKANTVKYTLDQGVQDNLTADYRIIVVEFALDNQIKCIQAGRKGAYFMITEQESYNYKTKNMKASFARGYGKFGMLQRLHFMYNLPSKLKIAQWLQQNIPADKKTLFFCASIQQANAVCQFRYHSKSSQDDFNKFCDGSIMQLSAVKSIAVGVNIPELDYAVIVQAEEQDLSTIQKIGRAARKSQDPNKKAVIFVLKATGTQDEKWVRGALASFDQSKIDYVSFNQLFNKGLSNVL